MPGGLRSGSWMGKVLVLCGTVRRYCSAALRSRSGRFQKAGEGSSDSRFINLRSILNRFNVSLASYGGYRKYPISLRFRNMYHSRNSGSGILLFDFLSLIYLYFIPAGTACQAYQTRSLNCFKHLHRCPPPPRQINTTGGGGAAAIGSSQGRAAAGSRKGKKGGGR